MQGAATSTGFEIVRKKRVYKEVANRIEQLILTRLKPGDRLPGERELAQMLGVSRSSLRDALLRLEVVGLVESRQGSATVVRDVSPDALIPPLAKVIAHKGHLMQELLDFRIMLEPLLAERAARYATPEDIARLDEILARQETKIRNGRLAMEEDSEFHYAIAKASRNSIVLRVLDVVMDMLRETRARSLQTKGRPGKSLSGHRRIIAAIKRHDVRGAEAAMRMHIRDIENIVRTQLSKVDKKAPAETGA